MTSTEDYFEDSLLSLFDEHPFAFSTSGPDEPYVYHPPRTTDSLADPISLTLPVAPSALHAQLQLTHIWLSSIYLADLIFTGRILVKDKRCAELGAGAGLPSIAAVRCGARSVVASDYAVVVQQDGEDVEDVLGVLRGNLRKACPAPQWEDGRDWDVVGHTWATSVEPLLNAASRDQQRPGIISEDTITGQRHFDTLLLADLLWSSESHIALITSVLDLLRPPPIKPIAKFLPLDQADLTLVDTTDRGGTAHVIAGLHTGRGPVERFQTAWKEAGGWIESRGEVRWGKSGDGWEEYQRPAKEGGEVGDWAELSSGEERGVVVWFEIGLGGR